MRKIPIKVGQRFGRLLFVRDVESIKVKSGTKRRSLFICDCGNEKIFLTYDVLAGKSGSCGCLHRELLSKQSTTHGLSKSKIYRVWASMFDRCYRENDKAYKNYGGRGITVSKSWHRFVNFYRDMGSTYRSGLEIDRKNNNRGYTKGNCQWVTRHQNARNKRGSIIYQGRHSDEVSVELGGSPSMISQRVRKLKWPIKKAFTLPVIKNKYDTRTKSTIHRICRTKVLHKRDGGEV